MHSTEQVRKPFMKQQGFHIAERSLHSARPDDAVQGSSQTSSKLAEGLQGLMDMCNAGSLMSPSPPAMASCGHVEVVGTPHTTQGVRRLVKSVIGGLKSCQEPERAVEGLGGTYFFKDDLGNKVAIVKPCDEEPLAPNNPKGFVGRALGEPGLKPTVRVGEAAIREVAAYLLDHNHFAQVPHTVLVKFTHPIFHVQANKPASPCLADAASFNDNDTQSAASLDSALSTSTTQLILARRASMEGSSGRALPCKIGSLQQFVAHDCDTSEIGTSMFSLQDVHRIAILDIRLFNTDRHAGNILVQRPAGDTSRLSARARLNQPQCRLLPIDHGFCLPEALEPPFFEWLHWPQAMMPFSEEELCYIEALDAQKDVELLQRELPSLRVESLRTLQVATALLKRCAAAGLNLFEIGTIVSRPLVGLDEDPSDLENMCTTVRKSIDEAVMQDEASDEEEDLGEEEDSDEDMSVTMPAASLPGGRGLSGSRLSGAVSLDRAHMHQNSFQDSASMESSPNRSLSDIIHRDEMLFDLDEEHSTSGSPRHTAALTAAASVPASSSSGHRHGSHSLQASGSLGSDRSSPPQSLSRGGGERGSSKRRSVQWGDGVQGSYAESEALSTMGPGAQMMAASMDASHFAMTGFTKGKRQSGRKPPRPHRLKKPGRAYPPPVAGGAPSATNAVFSDMSDEEWGLFMAGLTKCIDEALQDERWRQDVKKGKGTHAMQNMGVSCPRF
ncbi:hypothetical protein ABBQ38_005252 [Trebouxia sp. C0009 RCD-2024]